QQARAAGFIGTRRRVAAIEFAAPAVGGDERVDHRPLRRGDVGDQVLRWAGAAGQHEGKQENTHADRTALHVAPCATRARRLIQRTAREISLNFVSAWATPLRAPRSLSDRPAWSAGRSA